MKTKIKNTLPLIIVLLMLLTPTVQVVAQCISQTSCCSGALGTSNPGCAGCVGYPQCATPIPLDGGLSALLVAGVAYGAKRIYGKDKK